MITWVKKFFTDETAFIGATRAICIGAGTAVATGMMPIPAEYDWLGILLASLGGFIRAGDKNK